MFESSNQIGVCKYHTIIIFYTFVNNARNYLALLYIYIYEKANNFI
jgi:hypothetical protein